MRPRVLMNMASSLDGKINPQVRRGPFAMSRFPHDAARMLALRARADAVLIGAGNLRADDPDLGISPDAHPRRGAAPMRVVVTSRGEGLRGDEAIFDVTRGGPTVVAHAATMPDETRARLGTRAEMVVMGDAQVDVSHLLGWLAERGVDVVVAEGGGILNAQLFAARAVDELYLTVVPRILGGARAPTAVSGAGFGESEIPDGELMASEAIGSELFLRYAFTWE